MPKQQFVKTIFNFSFIIEFLGKVCRTSSRFLSFYLIFSHFLTIQTPSKDDISEDEWINPLLP